VRGLAYLAGCGAALERCGNEQTRSPCGTYCAGTSTDRELGATEMLCDMKTILDVSVRATDGMIGDVKSLYFMGLNRATVRSAPRVRR
jgi:hypothetical protein